MNKLAIKSLGYEILWNVFETVEEYNEAYNREGGMPSENPALDSANRNVVYRSSMAQGRKELCEKVEEESGFERELKITGKKKDGTDKTEFAQKDTVYIAAAIESGKITKQRVGELYQEIASAIDPDPSGRTPAEKKPSKPQKKFVEAAARIVEAGEERVAVVVAKLTELLGEEVASTVDGIAIGMQKDAKRREDEALANF